MKNSRFKRVLSIFLVIFLTVSLGFTSSLRIAMAKDRCTHKNISVNVDSERKCNIMAFDVNYDDNLFISLKGLAYALRGTSKAFNVKISGEEIEINKGVDYSEEPHLWTEEELEQSNDSTIARNKITVDGVERKYYSIIGKIGDGEYDAFMAPIHLLLMLDIPIEEVTEDDISIYTDNEISFIFEEIEESGYLQGVNALVIGNGSTNEKYYEHKEDQVYPIASTTKIMTYLLVMEAVSRGDISLNDKVVISKKAQKLSEGIDGTISMTAGMSVDINEVIKGMLLASSNECALALAEHVAGSEEEFVSRMNKKALELGLANAEFYNTNGLPVYTDQRMPAKMQNHMTASEMFVLASEVLNKYPEIMDITSIKTANLPTFKKDIKNTNAILYNMDEVKGIKTGTTNKSGACLISCAVVEKDGKPQNLISVLLGAEGEYDRSTVSEVAMRYAIDEAKRRSLPVEQNEKELPDDAESVVKMLIKASKNY